MRKVMPSLAGMALAILMVGASLWETMPTNGLVLVAVGILMAIPVIVYSVKEDTHG